MQAAFFWQVWSLPTPVSPTQHPVQSNRVGFYPTVQSVGKGSPFADTDRMRSGLAPGDLEQTCHSKEKLLWLAQFFTSYSFKGKESSKNSPTFGL